MQLEAALHRLTQAEPLPEASTGPLLIKSTLVRYEDVPPRAVRGLEDEAGRQGGEVDLIRRVPHTQQRYEVLLPHRVGDPLAHQELVRQTPFEGCGVIELEPVDLLSHGARRLQVAGASLEEPVPVFEGRTVLGRRQVTVAVVDRLLQPSLSRRGKNCFCSTLDTHRPHLSQPRPPASLLQGEGCARRFPYRHHGGRRHADREMGEANRGRRSTVAQPGPGGRATGLFCLTPQVIGKLTYRRVGSAPRRRAQRPSRQLIATTTSLGWGGRTSARLSDLDAGVGPARPSSSVWPTPRRGPFAGWVSSPSPR